MPERKSTIAGPALTGGPSGKPVVLISPETAWIVRSIARLSRSGPLRPAGAGGIDEARIDPAQLGPADPEPVHRPRREILEQHIDAPDHLQQQGAAALVLQIEGDRTFVRIQNRNREGRALAGRGAP